MISYGKTVRFFHKLDSGYIIRDYENSKLSKTGFSKLIFPLIKSGVWIIYNTSTGKKDIEYNYFNNQAISTKYWQNDNTFYIDSVKPGNTPPIFKGGNYAMLKFIAVNTRYPDEAKEGNIQGRVLIRFLITAQGEVVAPMVMNKVDLTLAKESIRVINLTKGMWIPGKNGSIQYSPFLGPLFDFS